MIGHSLQIIDQKFADLLKEIDGDKN